MRTRQLPTARPRLHQQRVFPCAIERRALNWRFARSSPVWSLRLHTRPPRAIRTRSASGRAHSTFSRRFCRPMTKRSQRTRIDGRVPRVRERAHHRASAAAAATAAALLGVQLRQMINFTTPEPNSTKYVASLYFIFCLFIIVFSKGTAVCRHGRSSIEPPELPKILKLFKYEAKWDTVQHVHEWENHHHSSHKTQQY